MMTIKIPFTTNSLGRVEFNMDVLRADRFSHSTVRYKLDSASDFTTISCADLRRLGYSEEFLKRCLIHRSLDGESARMADGTPATVRYLTNISIKFGDRELQGCRLFFALGSKLGSLLGSDILKYFNRDVNYDEGVLRLTERMNPPALSVGEIPIHIYSVESRVSPLNRSNVIKPMELF